MDKETRKAHEMGKEYAKTRCYELLTRLEAHCITSGIFLQVDDDRIWINDDYYKFA